MPVPVAQANPLTEPIERVIGFRPGMVSSGQCMKVITYKVVGSKIQTGSLKSGNVLPSLEKKCAGTVPLIQRLSLLL
jgi:hypothetical protein